MAMSHTRVHALLSGQTSLARKVFWAVPISEPWNAQQVATELARSGGGAQPLQVVAGCLKTLAEAGLVRRPDQHHYQKDPIKPKRPYRAHQEEEEMPAPTVVEALPIQPAAPKTAFDLMAEFAADMRAMAKRAEDIALRIEGEVQENAAAAEKLRTLQALLKGLG